MIRRSLGMGVLSLACASTEAPAPAQTAAEPHAPSSQPPIPAGSSFLLGVVGQGGVEYCPDGGFERQWLSLHPTIGRVSVGGLDDATFDPLMDQPVLAIGRPSDAPASGSITTLPPTVEPCMPAQMRSDWRQTPRGILIERDPAPTIQYFRLDTVRPLHELQARTEGDHVVVSLTNPVPVSLADVELRVHYEGCFGKPGTTTEVTAIGELGEGAHVSARAPMLIERDDAPDGRDGFRAFSVQLVGQGRDVVVDLDVRLEQLGVEVECPDR